MKEDNNDLYGLYGETSQLKETVQPVSCLWQHHYNTVNKQQPLPLKLSTHNYVISKVRKSWTR